MLVLNVMTKCDSGQSDKDIAKNNDDLIVSSLNEKISFLENELNAQRDIAIRALADLDNTRKRAIKERLEARTSAICSIVESILPVIDNFEYGIDSAKQHGANEILNGFQMVYDQLKSILNVFGVVQISPIGEEFDSYKHDCVRTQDVDAMESDGKILSVLRKGYFIDDKLIRPASVVVGKLNADMEDCNNE